MAGGGLSMKDISGQGTARRPGGNNGTRSLGLASGRPPRGPRPAGSPELWLRGVFLSSGWPCLRWLSPALGGQVLLPAPWGSGWNAGPQAGLEVRTAVLVSLHPQKQPPLDPRAQPAPATRTDTGVAGGGRPGRMQTPPDPPTHPHPTPTPSPFTGLGRVSPPALCTCDHTWL